MLEPLLPEHGEGEVAEVATDLEAASKVAAAPAAAPQEESEGRAACSFRSGFAAGCSLLRPAVVKGAIRYWWDTTTNRSFLTSKISRRASWRVTFPLVCFFFFLLDIIGVFVGDSKAAARWMVIDGCFFAVATKFAFSPAATSTLMPDAVLAFVLSIVCCCVDVSSSDVEVNCASFGPFWLSYGMMVSFFLGFHGLLTVWLWILGAVNCLTSSLDRSICVQVMADSAVIGCGCLIMEFTIASLYQKLQMELDCNQRLLDSATDGFGIVDSLTGKIVQASNKMCERFVASDASGTVVGMQLSSFVAHRDQVALGGFFGDAQHGLPPKAVLVTCIVADTNFEARLVPYKLQGTQIGFGVQIVGEMRVAAPVAEESPFAADEAATAASAPLHSDPLCWQGTSLPQGEDLAEEAAMDSGISQVTPSTVPVTLSSVRGVLLIAVCWAVVDVAVWEANKGTLSLSSWSLSCAGSPVDHSGTHGGGAAPSSMSAAASNKNSTVKKVDTRTIGIQVHLRAKPPAPMAASTVPEDKAEKATRRRRLARASAAVVEEGKPHLVTFKATPRSTRVNSLNMIVKSCNVSGTGCCPRHIAWMCLHGLISEELLGECGHLELHSSWQCPDCLALNDFDSDVDMDDEEDMESEQVCNLCNSLVTPLLPGHHQPTASNRARDATFRTDFHTSTGSAAGTASSSGVPPSDSSSFQDSAG
eukprot:CAMPEP_0178450490 /NCGR_PEP_ID=MMETSP0689_2-20121128/43153_1 /TAXON_ID=160604 /ORGANISM="Amphidinium massartii, Strain CS-259" /LENGTH=701 /DNA_ID=CAMNT_0020075961 /DNA_START=57 /DNA_END=2163 /DNA_ORIENTATION=-